MNVGDQIKCPHCGNETFLEKKVLMDGWTNLGEVLACNMCGEKIADIDNEPKELLPEKNDNAKDLLSNFLGVEEIEHPTLTATKEEKKFCRDCKHYIAHPFLTRCNLFDKEVNPMDDCEKFEFK